MSCKSSAAFMISTAVSITSPVSAYPIDCAILLCLAGGWPASVECSVARAEFVRRITPWPIEPPLQIWRCPMGSASYDTEFRTPGQLLRAVAAQGRRPVHPNGVDSANSLALRPLLLRDWAASGEQADIDISGRVFDFVRKIKVYHIDYIQMGDRDTCAPLDRSRIGTYGPQGGFSWQSYSATSGTGSWSLPDLSGAHRIDQLDCSARFRAMGVFFWRLRGRSRV